MTPFENPHTIIEITAHYQTPTGRDGSKSFSSVDEYHRWETRHEAKGYDINCLDTVRQSPRLSFYAQLISDSTGITDVEFLHYIEDRVRGSFNSGLSNLMREEIANEAKRIVANLRNEWTPERVLSVLSGFEYSMDGFPNRYPMKCEYEIAILMARHLLKEQSNG